MKWLELSGLDTTREGDQIFLEDVWVPADAGKRVNMQTVRRPCDENYEYLLEGDKIRNGDEFYHDGGWVPAIQVGSMALGNGFHRRLRPFSFNEGERNQVDAWFVKGITGMLQILMQRVESPLPLSDDVIRKYHQMDVQWRRIQCLIKNMSKD